MQRVIFSSLRGLGGTRSTFRPVLSCFINSFQISDRKAIFCSSRTISHVVKDLTEPEFQKVADDFLETLETHLFSLENEVENFDLTNSMGVLTIKLGNKGTYVINKQTPNRQIWWSSPLSGPRRYYYNGSRWLNTRDNHDLLVSLREELNKLLGIDLEL